MYNYGSQTRIGYGTRSVATEVVNGWVTIRDTDTKGVKYVEQVRFIDSIVVEYKVMRNGKYTYWIKYGEFEKARDTHNYSYIKRYRAKTAKGYHGLTTRWDQKLFGHTGTCYTFYSRGRWLWQKFVYSNGRIAYHAKEQIFKGATAEGVYPDGSKLFHISCPNGFLGKSTQGMPFINLPDERSDYERARYYSPTSQEFDYSKEGNSEYTIWDKVGRVKEHGVFVNRQKSGEWIAGYKRYFLLNGLVVPKKLYEAKPEDLDPNIVLRQPNAQVRAMFLKKIGIARVVKECKGTLVDKDPVTGNELYDFKTGTPKTAEEIERFERILKVVCPSTKNEYFLRIPYDEHFNTTEKARQGTFNGFDPEAKPIAFAVET